MLQKKLISEDSASDYKSWQAPVVEGSITSHGSSYGRPPTAEDIQDLQKQAYEEAKKEGYQQGNKQGYLEGKQKAETEFKQRIELLDSYLSLISQPLNNLDEKIEQEIVNLSLLIARHIIRRELKLEPGEIVAVVREAIKAIASSSQDTYIHLHPEDAELVKSAFSLKDEELNWKIEEDILLMRGDCRIETNSSLIDASVESRLSAIAAQMLGGERNNDE